MLASCCWLEVVIKYRGTRKLVVRLVRDTDGTGLQEQGQSEPLESVTVVEVWIHSMQQSGVLTYRWKRGLLKGKSYL